MKQMTFSEIKEQLNEWIQLDYIPPEDIPSIDLYMDQVTTFMETRLSGTRRFADDKILTKTMINNYSKNDLLPPSNKKKYSKDHIILLIYIYYLKNFLSISDIHHLLHPMTDGYFQTENKPNMESIYKDILQLEHEYGIKVKESITDVYDIADKLYQAEDNYLKTFAMIIMLSYDIYTKKQLVEKMIASLPMEISSKKEEQKYTTHTRKKAKESSK